MILNVNLTVKHKILMLDDLHILRLPGSKIRLKYSNDLVLKDVKFPKFCLSLKKVLSLSGYKFKRISQIGVAEVSNLSF